MSELIVYTSVIWDPQALPGFEMLGTRYAFSPIHDCLPWAYNDGSLVVEAPLFRFPVVWNTPGKRWCESCRSSTAKDWRARGYLEGFDDEAQAMEWLVEATLKLREERRARARARGRLL